MAKTGGGQISRALRELLAAEPDMLEGIDPSEVKPADIVRAYKQRRWGKRQLNGADLIAAAAFLNAADPEIITPPFLKEITDRTEGKVPDRLIQETTSVTVEIPRMADPSDWTAMASAWAAELENQRKARELRASESIEVEVLRSGERDAQVRVADDEVRLAVHVGEAVEAEAVS